MDERRQGRRRASETDEDLWERISRQFPRALDPWSDALANEHMVGAVVQDLIKTAAPVAGRGTRQMPDTDTAKAIIADLRGDVSTDPFPIAFDKLCGKHSAAGVAARTGLSRWQIIRLRKPPDAPGHQQPTIAELAAIANGYHVSPMYFAEYRLAALLSAVATSLTPERSASLIRRARGAR